MVEQENKTAESGEKADGPALAGAQSANQLGKSTRPPKPGLRLEQTLIVSS